MRSGRTGGRAVRRSVGAVLLLAWAEVGLAQDTARPRVLDPVVVTAERTTASLSTSTAAVTRISAAELARYPRATLADLLRMAPGITLVDFDGLGFDPQLMVRGFYGGGEAEYVVVLVDGRPVNQLHTGVVAWDVLPPVAAIEAVEVVRGGASSLYGDAAIGGVINVITKAATRGVMDPTRLQADASAGTYRTWLAEVALGTPASRTGVGFNGAVDHTSGFRQHAERTAARALAALAIGESPDSRVDITLASHWREFDEPGPQVQSLPLLTRAASDPLFRFDHTKDQDLSLTLDGSRRLGGGTTRLSGQAGGELRRVDAIRTLPLAPGFGDTKERLAANNRFRLGAQLETGDAPMPHTDRLVVGIEASRGALDSKYYQVATGTRDDYQTTDGARGDLDTRGESTRTAGAAYAEFIGAPWEVLRISLGGRFDVLHDSFDPSLPVALPSRSTTHTVFSPSAGTNLGFKNGRRSSASLYASFRRSFKAPTLDQLYDQRTIPIPSPPFAITTSNPDLKPQHGTSFEAGLYQQNRVGEAVHVTGSLSAYHMDMKDELDFDVASFQYVNIGRSRHRGVEAGIQVDGARASGFANYTLQAATSRSGANVGKRLKAIPRHTLTGGLSLQPLPRIQRLRAGIVVNHASGMYLDDANTVPLAAYTRVDGRVSFGIAQLDLFVDVRNLFDARYSTTGFLDPSGSGDVYLYPAVQRTVEVGLRGTW